MRTLSKVVNFQKETDLYILNKNSVEPLGPMTSPAFKPEPMTLFSNQIDISG